MGNIGSRASDTLVTLPAAAGSLSNILSLPEEDVEIKQIKGSMGQVAAAFTEWAKGIEIRAGGMHQYRFRKEKDGSFAELLLAFLPSAWIGRDQ